MVSLGRMDFVGAGLVLAGSCLLVACLEIGGNQYPWNSIRPLALLISAIVSWMLLVVWQWCTSRGSTSREPVLPWRILTNRFAMGNMLTTLTFGAAFFSIALNFPQRFQIVDGLSALDAGYRLLPVTVVAIVGSILAGHLSQKAKVPHLYLLLAGQSLQILGLGLYTGLDASRLDFPGVQYFFFCVLGIGLGITLNTSLTILPLVCEKRDRAVGVAFVGQFRALGGSIGIAGCANLLNKVLDDDLAGLVASGALSADQLAQIRESSNILTGMSEEVRESFVRAYVNAFQKEMWLVTGLIAVGVLATLMVVERRPRRME